MYTLGMVLMACSRHHIAVIVLSPTAGLMYATLFTLPYLILANYHTKTQVCNSDNLKHIFVYCCLLCTFTFGRQEVFTFPFTNNKYKKFQCLMQIALSYAVLLMKILLMHRKQILFYNFFWLREQNLTNKIVNNRFSNVKEGHVF